MSLGIYNHSFDKNMNINIILIRANEELYKASQIVVKCAKKVEQELSLLIS